MSVPPARVCFPPFEFDLATGTLWQGTRSCRLKPQAAAVLRYLIEHAGRVVSKDELLAVLWPDVRVGAGVLKTCLWELRQALRDQLQAPRFIETLPRRGYRFISPLDGDLHTGRSGWSPVAPTALLLPTVEPNTPAGLVGREAELAFLRQRLGRALAGERQVVFVTGEAGIGKTALVTAFFQQIAGDADVWVARGQCIEPHGAGEAYLPVLEALGRLGREFGGQRLVRLLHQYAPTWLAHLPMPLSATERAKVHQATTGVTRERMLRELAEAVEILTEQVGLVLWFEDVQWGDPSTLEWVGYVARRPGLARLLVVSTCRPVVMLEPGHALTTLTQELFLHGQGVELELRGITASAVADYLFWRLLPGEEIAALQTLAQAIHQHTEGHPLFMVNVVEHLLAQGILTPSDGQVALQETLALMQRGVPRQLQQLIESQLARLHHEEQALLAVASVAGAEFSAAVVAAGLEVGVEAVEARCAGLAQRALFVQSRDLIDWPDGTVATRYAFLHALYAHVLYERMPPSHRRAVHGRLGQRLEQAYGARPRCRCRAGAPF